jgi:hypothetical protein
MYLNVETQDIPICGVLGFFNTSILGNPEAYLFFSSTAFTLFCTHLTKLRMHIHDCKGLQDAYDNNTLEFSVVKSYTIDPGPIELRSAYERSIADYRSKGYTDMRDGYKAITYKIKKYVLADFRDNVTRVQPLVYVCGRSPNAGEVVLGIFDSIPNADDWLASTYKGKATDILPIFANNELTIEYHKENGYALYRA